MQKPKQIHQRSFLAFSLVARTDSEVLSKKPIMLWSLKHAIL